MIFLVVNQSSDSYEKAEKKKQNKAQSKSVSQNQVRQIYKPIIEIKE